MEPINTQSTLPHPAQVVPFFVLNAHLEKDHLQKRVQECAAAGFQGIVLHARAGLQTPYLSDAWFAAIECCLNESERLGLKCWLYDEFPYPSGAAGGRVIRHNPDFAERHLVVRRFSLEGEKTANLTLGSEPVLAAFLAPVASNGVSRLEDSLDVTGCIGLRNSTWTGDTNWNSRNYYNTGYSQLHHCPRAIDVLPEQAFEMTPGAGTWELVVFLLVTGGDYVEPFGHYVDVSNPDATSVFLRETHAAYQKRFGDRFGSLIPGIFTDEPKFRTSFPWSNAIAAAWDDYQLSPTALLSLLPEAKEASPVRQRYRETTKRLFSQNWLKPIRNWCGDAGLKLIGHISPEEDWWQEAASAGSILSHLREFSIPGCDLIIPAVGDMNHPVLNLTPTLAASAAAQSGASQVLCEVFGCSDYTLTMQTVKRIGDWLASSGINFFVLHGCFYSLAGLRRFDAPPTFLPPSTLHPFLEKWSEYIRGVASAIGPTGINTSLALVRPMTHFYGLGEQGKAEAQCLFEQGITSAATLLGKGLPFHWIDDSDLLTAQIAPGKIGIGHWHYSQVMVFENLLSKPMKAALEAIRRAGIEVLTYDQANYLEGPLLCDSGEVRTVKSNDGRYFCLNLSATEIRFELEGNSYGLEGHESRWINPSIPSSLLKEVVRIPLPSDWKVTPQARNIYRLKNWTHNGEPYSPGLNYRCDEGSSPSATTVFGLVPTEPKLNKMHPLCYEAFFSCSGNDADATLTLCFEEAAIRGNWRAYLNNKLLTGGVDTHYNGLARVEYSLNADGELLNGDNQLRIEVDATDVRDGLLLAPFLAGNFRVSDIASHRIVPFGGSDLLYGSQWAELGFPHYSGTMFFEQSFTWKRAINQEEEVYLEFVQPPAGMIEVFLNGQSLGSLLWAPWKLILNPMLKEGENKLQLRVTNTLSNYIYGIATPSGPLANVAIVAMRCIEIRSNSESTDELAKAEIFAS